MSQKVCIGCLRYFEHCECPAGPRESRHPAGCQCSMCELGRELMNEKEVDHVHGN